MASSTSIKILTCTANMGNAEPTASSMKHWVPEGGACHQVTPLNQEASPLLSEEGSTFDIVCIGMQEATWKKKNKEKEGQDGEEDMDEDDLDQLAMEVVEADEEDQPSEEKKQKKLDLLKMATQTGAAVASSVQKTSMAAAKTASKTAQSAAKTASKTAQSAAKTAQNPTKLASSIQSTGKAAASSVQKTGLAAANMASSTAQKAFEMTTEALLKEPDSDYLRELLGDILGEKYQLVKEYQRGQMRLYLYVKQSLVEEISGVDLKAENTGIGNVLANKGGIVCTLTVRTTRISFLTAHLAAHEGQKYYQARNGNLRDILRGAKVGPKHLNGLDAAMISHHMFVMGDLNYRTRLPNAATMETPEQVQTVLEIVQQKDWDKLYSYDELSKGVENKELLVQFQTLPCNFNPTFKMLREEGFQHKTQRVPSYTDRVLYTSAPGLSKNLTPIAYEPCPGFITSDHKPLRGAWSIALPSSDGDPQPDTQQPVSMVFKDMKCTNLPPADANGFADPYIMFLSDPPGLVEDNRSQQHQKKKPGFGDKKWPVTAYRKKNLNPEWPEEVRLCIHDTTVAVMESAMLYLTIWDVDYGTTDDLMCSTVMNLKDLTTFEEGQEEKQVKIDQPLLKYGLEQGRIQGTVVVSKGNIQNDSDSPEKRKSGVLASVGKAFAGVKVGGTKAFDSANKALGSLPTLGGSNHNIGDKSNG